MTRLDALEKLLLEALKEVKQLKASSAGMVTLETEVRGFSLQQALFTMLKKWDAKTPGWPIEEGLERQARTYGTTVEKLCELISSGPLTMKKRFESSSKRLPGT